MNKEEHIAMYKESMTINFPIDIKYINEDEMVSAYIPIIGTYFSAKTIEDAERKAQGLVAIWIKYNLENHMRKTK
jgi:hypothetical protein